MSHPAREIIFTAEQGNKYLELCEQDHPRDFGPEKKFANQDIGTYDRNCRHLIKALKKASPGFQARPKRIPFFGPIENWKERPKRTMRLPDGKGGIQEMVVPGQIEEPLYDLQDSLLETAVHPNAYAVDALQEMMVILTHPGSPKHLSPAEQDRIVWDLAERMDIVPWLEGQIGLKPEPKEAAPAAPATPPAAQAVPATS